MVIAPRSTASVIRTFASAGESGPSARSESLARAARTVATISSSGPGTTKASFTIEPRLCSMKTTAVRAVAAG